MHYYFFFKHFFNVNEKNIFCIYHFPQSALCGFKFPPVIFSARKTYFSCSTGLPTIDYLTFCLCLTSILKSLFLGQTLCVYNFFSFSTLKTSFHCVIACIVPGKSDIIFIFVSLYLFPPPPLV